ncbi:XrtA system polysaccharide chain length determinant [Oxalobacteraceae bacterium A2-2]
MQDIVSQLLASLQGIWKYRWQALAVAWLVAVAGWAKVASLPDDYQAMARVFVDTQSILKPLMSGMTTLPNVEQQVSIMSRTLLSRPNVERVTRMVDLDLKARSARERQEQLDELMSKIKIAGTGSYDIYTITYNHSNPRLARDVVQSLLTIFVEGSFKDKKGDSQKAVQFIEDQINSYEEKLVAAENTVKDFKLRHNGVLPRQGLEYGAQLQMSADALAAAQLELLEAEQARKAIQGQISGDEPVLDAALAPSAGGDPELEARITALNKSLDTLRLQYTELHPDIVAARRLLAQLEQRREELAKRQPAGDPGRNYSPMLQQLKVAATEADAKVAAIRARVREYGARHARLQAQSNAVPEVESQLAQLNRDYQVNKDNYEKLIARREAARMSGDLSSTTEMMTFKIIDPPAVPATPAGPRRALLYSVVLAGALLAGAAAALVASQIRPTFLTLADLRSATGLPVLGTVSMNWTDAERRKRRRAQYWFGAALSCLVLGYGGVMAAAWLSY